MVGFASSWRAPSLPRVSTFGDSRSSGCDIVRNGSTSLSSNTSPSGICLGIALACRYRHFLRRTIVLVVDESIELNTSFSLVRH